MLTTYHVKVSLLLHQAASASETNGLELGAESEHIDNEDVDTADHSGPELEHGPGLYDIGKTVFDSIAAGPLYDAEDPAEAPCLSVVLGIMYAWIGYHKATDVAAEDVWNMLAMIIPPSHNMPAFSTAKGILEKHLNQTCEIIEMCPCDRMAYFDCESGPLRRFKNAHRTRCHIKGCGLSRLVRIKTQYGSRDVPRKVMYYNPLKFFMQDVFKDRQLVHHLHHGCGDHPQGTALRSVATNSTLLLT